MLVTDPRGLLPLRAYGEEVIDFGLDCWTGLEVPLMEVAIQREISKYLPVNTVIVIAPVLPPLDDNEEDETYWSLNASGQFSARSDNESLKQHWKNVWGWEGPERVRMFLWLAMHARLLTNGERARRGFVEHGFVQDVMGKPSQLCMS
ncbi:conserved hypothetical protein [Ricinus communis]|uniref:Reverse transcriptase zinc-binding domain-containing protein n=1 Tax=Ricinus communis TaxID=3988 RepID=B9SEB5_RICCO|nr:conserved hypothetical protein [Ricinus communis]